MAEQQDDHKRQEQATYGALIALFLGLYAVVAKRGQKRHAAVDLGWLDLAMLGLTAFRAGRLTAYDQVTEPLREPVTATQSDSYGTSQTTVPEGSGVRKAIGSLVSCPTCVATWVAALLVYGLRIAPGPTRLFLAITSTAGLAEILNSATEALSWTGRAERKQAKPSSD